jgi:hypothetical protein
LTWKYSCIRCREQGVKGGGNARSEGTTLVGILNSLALQHCNGATSALMNLQVIPPPQSYVSSLSLPDTPSPNIHHAYLISHYAEDPELFDDAITFANGTSNTNQQQNWLASQTETSLSHVLQVGSRTANVKLTALQESMPAVFDMRVGHSVIVAGRPFSNVHRVFLHLCI